MIESMKKLHSIYPMCHIIAGCDANTFIPGTYKEYTKGENLECFIYPN